MFCRNSGAPRDDLTCTTDKPASTPGRNNPLEPANVSSVSNALRSPSPNPEGTNRGPKSESTAAAGSNRAGLVTVDRPVQERFNSAVLAVDVAGDDAIEKIRQLQREFGDKYELSLDAAFHFHLKEQFGAAIAAYKSTLTRFGVSSYVDRLVARAEERKSPAIRTGIQYRSGGNIVSNASAHYKFIGSRLLVEVGSVLLETTNASAQYEVCGLRAGLEKTEGAKQIHIFRSETAAVTGMIAKASPLVLGPVDLIIPLPHDFDLFNTTLNLEIRLVRNGRCDISFTLRHRPGASGL